MRSVGIENSVTSLALTTHQANNAQYQRSADEAENFVNGSTREYTTSRNRKKLGCSSLAPMN